MKTIFTLLITISLLGSAVGQNFSDALRYSNSLESGSARTVGVGNSIGALGADFATLSINPAGLATYKNSEFSFSPSFLFGNGEASLNNSATESSSIGTKFFIESAGLVKVRRPRRSKWRTSNFGVGINRIADFNETIEYSGFGTGSITERWLENADNLTPDELDDFETGPAYVVGAIFDFDEDLFYGSDIILSDEIQKSQTVDRTGGMNELVFNWAGNYNNKFSLGVSAGIPIINYEEDKSYFESDPQDLVPFFNELRFDESLSVSGTGFNFKLGTILHFIPNIRIGLSYESPSWMEIEENFSTSVGYSYTDDEETITDREESPDGQFRYRLKTPSNSRLDLAYLIRTNSFNGFISGGIKYINYAKNEFNLTAFTNDPDEAVYENQINDELSNELTDALSYNLGAELAFEKLRLRGGLILQSSPYSIDDGELSQIYSAGIGIRWDYVFMDFAWRGFSTQEAYIPYNVDNESRLQQVNIDKQRNKLVFTMGFKF